MTTLQRPNSRPVAATLLAVFVLTAALSALVQGFAPATSFAAAQYPYKSQPQWYNGPVAKPFLSGDNMAFVTTWEAAGQFLYVTDLAAGKDEKITSYPVAANTEIGISNNYVVWSNGYKNKWNIFLFDKFMHSTQVLVDSMNEVGRPSINGTQIVWREANFDQGGAMIRYYNHTGTEFRTLSAGKFYSNPVVAGNRVAWFETSTGCNNDAYRLCNPDAGSKDLVIYDVANRTQQVIAQNVSTVYAPAISVSRVVWTAKVNGHYDLFQYEFSTGSTTRLTNNDLDETYPVLGGGRIGYLGMSLGGSRRVAHVYDITTKQDTAMAFKGANHGWVTITDNKMAWVETRKDSRIYIYDFVASASKTDVDTDGLGQETETKFGTDPQEKDTDGDGISDTDEIVLFKTNPLAVDSDGDGLTDYRETFLYKSSPTKFDTDGDGYNDGLEIKTNHSPTSKSAKKVSPKIYEWTAQPR